MRRLQIRQDVIMDFLKNHPDESAYTQENIAKAYLQLSMAFMKESYRETIGNIQGDISFHLASAMKNNEVKFQALKPTEYANRFHEIKTNAATHFNNSYVKMPITHKSYFFPKHDNIRGLEKPLLLITRPENDAFVAEENSNPYTEMLSRGMHEGRHYLERKRFAGKGKWNEGVQIKEETATFLTEIWWEAQHGNATRLKWLLQESPTGFATRIVDYLENEYRRYWEG
jgi:hypothetical protein